jgi:hypothetical protein
MPTVRRFVIWERPSDFRKTHPKLASMLGEVGIESLDRVHGREPSFLGRDVSEIERLLVSSNLGLLAQQLCRQHACELLELHTEKVSAEGPDGHHALFFVPLAWPRRLGHYRRAFKEAFQ